MLHVVPEGCLHDLSGVVLRQRVDNYDVSWHKMRRKAALTETLEFAVEPTGIVAGRNNERLYRFAEHIIRDANNGRFAYALEFQQPIHEVKPHGL